ncbi:MAG: phosphatase PAP2 family protein [Bacteroides sp.]|nr:phosphatase PAP2 family protein [Bacteroides sp.]
MLDTLIQIDTSLLLAVNGARSPFLDHFMYLFSDKLIWVPMYLSILYVLWKNYEPKQFLCCIVAVALVILFADQVTHELRGVFCRLRPSNLENPVSEFVQIVNGKRGGRYSFPSCHAANTWALAFYIFLLLRRRWLSLTLVLWALITCYSRAYLGVHYPGDLLVGSLVGIAGASIIFSLQRLICKLRRRDLKHPYAPILLFLLTVVAMAAWSTFKAFAA